MLDRLARLSPTPSDDMVFARLRQPPQVRANIISLSLFVSRHTSAVMKGEEDFETLIELNRMMMQGLGGQPASEPSAA